LVASAVAALFCAGVAQAQDIDGLFPRLRVFNDIEPGEGSTAAIVHNNSVNPGTATITDSFTLPAGGVNRHDVLLSSDNGASAHAFNIADKFTFSVDVNLASVVGSGREAGIRMNSPGMAQEGPGGCPVGPPSCNGDALYIVKDNGEIAAFGAGAPFNLFAAPGSAGDYDPGTTVTLGFTYLGNEGAGPARIRYFLDRLPGLPGGYTQTPFAPFTNLEEGMFTGFNVAAYAQGGVGPVAPSSYTATFSDITFIAIPEPSTMMLGFVAVAGVLGWRRRR
jgi:hypothetical protein